MGTLWLYAISLDDVRDFFAAPNTVAEELLSAAEEVTHETPKPTLLGKVGPLFKHPIAPVIELPGPTMDDAHALIEGRALPPDRLGPAWVIVRHWCSKRCCDSAEVTVDRSQLATLDFAHVASGLSSQFSFGTLLARDPHLPLLPAPGLVVGWMPNAYAHKMAAQWPLATESDNVGAPPNDASSATFSRDDPTGVGLTWPLQGNQPQSAAEWQRQWNALNGFFVRAAKWTFAESRDKPAPDVLAMYQ